MILKIEQWQLSRTHLAGNSVAAVIFALAYKNHDSVASLTCVKSWLPGWLQQAQRQGHLWSSRCLLRGIAKVAGNVGEGYWKKVHTPINSNHFVNHLCMQPNIFEKWICQSLLHAAQALHCIFCGGWSGKLQWIQAWPHAREFIMICRSLLFHMLSYVGHTYLWCVWVIDLI